VLVPGTYANVDVPSNARCILPSFGTVPVTGNVTVESGAQLDLPPGPVDSTFVVTGSLIGVHAASFEFDNVGVTVNIHRSVHLTGTTSAVHLRGLSIGGTLTIRDTTSAFFALFFNTVGGRSETTR
jgi:hypothetical protein